MGKNLDVMKELEDIGALGDKVPEVVVRRPAPTLVLSIARDQPAPSVTASAVRTDKLLIGFTEQLRTLEVALQGMLSWCAAAREQAQALVVAPAIEVEAIETTEKAVETPIEEVAPPPSPAPPSKPKFSKEELKRLFLDPTFVPQTAISAEPPITVTPVQENS